MRRIPIFIFSAIFIFLGADLFAQSNVWHSQKEIDAARVRTRAFSDGFLFWDHLFQNPSFESPKDSGASAIYAAGLWLGALDPSGQLHLSVHDYTTVQASGQDFWPGPIAADSAQTAAYDRIWRLDRSEWEAFQDDWADNGQIDSSHLYPVIFSWPAHDTTGFGDTVMLAPFVDVDGDPSTYNPGRGDYPVLKGDQMLWWVFNDVGPGGNRHSAAMPMGLELQACMYVFDCPDSAFFADAVFVEYEVINRSNIRLDEAYFGLWTDFDLGHPGDDYLACDSLRGMYYAYNADAFDDGPSGYGLNPPAAGAKFLKGPLADIDGRDNNRNGIIDEAGEDIRMSHFITYFKNPTDSINGSPGRHATDYYNYLMGRDMQGNPFVDNYGNGGAGTGWPVDGTGPKTSMAFTGDVCQGTGWTMGNSGIVPTDLFSVAGAAGPFTFQPGESNTISTVYFTSRAYYNDQLGSVCELLSTADDLQAFHDSGYQSCRIPDLVYPGDANHDQIANVWDLLPIGLNYGSQGPVRPNASLNWIGQPASDWSDSLGSGINLKHVDCNGDGIIQANDTLAILQNYELTHTSFKTRTTGGAPLLLDITGGPFSGGDTVFADLYLGNMDTLAQNIYGLALSLRYDTAQVKPGSVRWQAANSFLGSPGSDLLTISMDLPQAGRIDIGLVRNDGMDQSGYGRIGGLVIVIDDDITKREIPMTLNWEAITAIDVQEEEVPLDGQVNRPGLLQSLSQMVQNQLSIYPNPFKEEVYLESPQHGIKQIQLLDIYGRIVKQWDMKLTHKALLPCHDLSVGTYVVKVITPQGIAIKKLLKQP